MPILPRNAYHILTPWSRTYLPFLELAQVLYKFTSASHQPWLPWKPWEKQEGKMTPQMMMRCVLRALCACAYACGLCLCLCLCLHALCGVWITNFESRIFCSSVRPFLNSCAFHLKMPVPLPVFAHTCKLCVGNLEPSVCLLSVCSFLSSILLLLLSVYWHSVSMQPSPEGSSCVPLLTSYFLLHTAGPCCRVGNLSPFSLLSYNTQTHIHTGARRPSSTGSNSWVCAPGPVDGPLLCCKLGVAITPSH